MTAATRIYKYLSTGTDWATLMMDGGLGLTLVRLSDFNTFYTNVGLLRI